ncbi:hypothetical protein BGY98DRAFT_666157 [Russula aff. rugulosa BPL654]|nr:hypothetical protein BGY98DRAFT_666157 [Russula aff. rugulosa BPL654]
MAARVYFVPGIILLFCAFILSLLVTISLPTLPTLDIVRCRFTATRYAHPGLILDTRFGVWGTCTLAGNPGAVRVCQNQGSGYSYTFTSKPYDIAIVGPSSISGLVAHPIATVVIFIAFISSLSFRATLALFASVLTFVASLVTLTVFAFDIALFIDVRNKARQALQGLPDPQIRDVVTLGPGFWITFVSLILLFMATCTAWLGRRRSRMEGATDILPSDSEKSGIFARFRGS